MSSLVAFKVLHWLCQFCFILFQQTLSIHGNRVISLLIVKSNQWHPPRITLPPTIYGTSETISFSSQTGICVKHPPTKDCSPLIEIPTWERSHNFIQQLIPFVASLTCEEFHPYVDSKSHPLHGCPSPPSGRVLKKDTLMIPRSSLVSLTSHLRIHQLILIRPNLLITAPFLLLPTLSSLPDPKAPTLPGSRLEI